MATTPTSSNQEGKGPKLEDFLGGYSENASEENQSQQPISNFHDMYYQSSGGAGINVNIPASFSPVERGIKEDINNSYHFFQACHQPHHAFQETPTLSPQFLLPNADPNANPGPNSMYNGGMDGSTSISGIKSWLRQNQYVPGKQLAEPSECNFQSLTLSMSPVMQPGSSEMVPVSSSSAAAASADGPKYPNAKPATREPIPRKSIETFGQRTSQYRGVTRWACKEISYIEDRSCGRRSLAAVFLMSLNTMESHRHRWTGRYEAHLWDNSCRKEGQTRKGRQGGYDKEEKAAKAYDLAALKYWGPTTHINFPLSTYEKELEEMKHMTRQEFVAHLRRFSL